MSVKNDGNNIVLINKVNTSPALLDYKYSIYSIFFTFACKESSYSFGTRSVILHIWLLSMSTLIELQLYTANNCSCICFTRHSPTRRGKHHYISALSGSIPHKNCEKV